MGVLDTTYTFQNNDVITSTRMNNIIDQTTFTSDALVSGNETLMVVGGKLQVKAGGIKSNELASDSVTSVKIIDGAVTPAKLSSGGPSWDGGTLTLAQRGVEIAGNSTSSGNCYIDFHSTYPIIDNDARIIRNSGINGTLQIDNNGTGAITLTASGGVTFGTANMPTPATSAKIYGIRAWARVNSAGGIVENKGFSSISRGGEGFYNLVLSVTPTDNPCVIATCHTPAGNNNNYSAAVQINSLGSFTVKTGFEDVNLLSDMNFSIMVLY